jgi:hypothetical protein
MSKSKKVSAQLVLSLVAEVPGQTASSYRSLLGARIGYVGRTLRRAAGRGAVEVARVDGEALYFPAVANDEAAAPARKVR